MSDRRTFLKHAGMLSLASLPENLAADSQENTKPAAGHSAATAQEPGEIVLENAEMRLVISAAGYAQSLIHKATGQECLVKGTSTPMFTATQYRPYENELQLSLVCNVTAFPVEQLRREDDLLIASFGILGYEANIRLKITDAYIGFQMENLTYKGNSVTHHRHGDPIDETVFVQLPVRTRKNLGEWLNVVWDESVAVNLMGTDPYAKINAEPRLGFYLLRAGTVDAIKQEGVGAALIVTHTPHLLDRVARVEEDYNLPRGVQSRRSKEYKHSYYEMEQATPADFDQHVKYAKMGGFRLMQVNVFCFTDSVGHYPWRPEWSGGMADLQGVVKQITDAGMVPGLHFYYNKASKKDAYVTPVPDPRLNTREHYTLAQSIDAAATVIPVEENPRLATMMDARRFLKIQNELVHYTKYTTTPPYQFEGCERGALGTGAAPHDISTIAGVLDVDTWPIFVRFTQDTNIQEESAERLRRLYGEAGFKFVYFDGAEDTPPPYWFTVSRAQWVVQKALDPQPLMAEGACKSHFSWHILTRGNAYDVFRPEVTRNAVQTFPGEEIKRVAKDFTSIDFGWIGYWPPNDRTIGTQPDMIEYVTSVAAGFGCPASFEGNIEKLRAHPRTPDNMEVFRRWEDVRARGWLTEQHKLALRNMKQEHLLLVNERGDFELVPYQQIENVAGADRPGRAFVFERHGSPWVVYWHISGEGTLEIPIAAKRLKLMRDLGKPLEVNGNDRTTQLPLGERRFLQCTGVARADVIAAFRNGKIS